MIKLVTEKVCPICSMVKNILKIKKMDYEQIDFESEDGKKLLEEHNAKSLPLFIDGNIVHTGHDVIKYLKSK